MNRRSVMACPVAFLLGTAILFVATIALNIGSATHLQAGEQKVGDLPDATEPRLAEPGDWAADFNDAQIACYNGSMSACDSIWLNDRVLLDSFLHDYGRTCGGRVDLREIRRANLTCSEAFPGHE
jgi:hypothetical protein